ncbi:MAG: diguanylate cyclase [Nitrospiraceae bacterium]
MAHGLKWLYSFVMPGGLVLLAAMSLLRPRGLPDWSLSLVYAYAYIFLGAGILLGWYMGRSRVLFATLLLALADRALMHFWAGEAATESVGRLVFNSVALLLPLNFMVLSFITESPMVTRREIMRLGLILLQAVLVAWVGLFGQPDAAASLESPIVDPRYARWTPIPQPALLAFGAAFVHQMARSIRLRNPLERGFVWALLAAFVALHGTRAGWSPTNFFATASLILIIATYHATHTFLHYDEVTGVRKWDDLKVAMRRLRGQYAIAMVDIDRLKQVNEQFGRLVGDQVLRHVAAKITKVSGDGEAFCHMGGKFAVIFRGKTLAEAVPHLQALRKAVEASPFALPARSRSLKNTDAGTGDSPPGKDLQVTITIGVAHSNARKVAADQVLKAAERALDRAKKAGRNQVAA